MNITAVKINSTKLFKFRYHLQYLICPFLEALASVLKSLRTSATPWKSGGWNLSQKEVTFSFKSDDTINPAERKNI